MWAVDTVEEIMLSWDYLATNRIVLDLIERVHRLVMVLMLLVDVHHCCFQSNVFLAILLSYWQRLLHCIVLAFGDGVQRLVLTFWDLQLHRATFRLSRILNDLKNRV